MHSERRVDDLVHCGPADRSAEPRWLRMARRCDYLEGADRIAGCRAGRGRSGSCRPLRHSERCLAHLPGASYAERQRKPRLSARIIVSNRADLAARGFVASSPHPPSANWTVPRFASAGTEGSCPGNAAPRHPTAPSPRTPRSPHGQLHGLAPAASSTWDGPSSARLRLPRCPPGAAARQTGPLVG